MNSREASKSAEEYAKLRARPFNTNLPPCTQRLWPMFDKYLHARCLSYTLARANYWFPSDQAGDDSPRVVILATATPPNLFWQARAMDDNPKRYQSPAAPKGDALVIVWPMLDRTPQGVVLFEGPMDALAVAEMGYVGVACMGLPTDLGLDALCRGPGGARIVVLDSDYKEPMLKAAGMLLERGVRVRVVDPYPAKDFAELSPSRRKELLEG